MLDRSQWKVPPLDSPELAHIIEELRPLAAPTSVLLNLPDNAHQGDVGMLSVSISTFKQRAPLVVNRRTGHVEAGNSRLAAMAPFAWVAVVLVDDDPVAERAYAVADNRAAALGWDDEALLARGLLAVHDFDKQLFHATGYDDDDLDRLVASVLAEDVPGLAAALHPVEFAEKNHEHPEPNVTWNDRARAYVPPLPPPPAPAPQVTVLPPLRDPLAELDPDPMVTISIAVQRSMRRPLTDRLTSLMNETSTLTMGAALAAHFELIPDE